MCKSNIVRNKRNCDGINVMCKSKEEYLCSAYTLHRAVRRSKFQLVLHRFSQKNNKKEKKETWSFLNIALLGAHLRALTFVSGDHFSFEKNFAHQRRLLTVRPWGGPHRMTIIRWGPHQRVRQKTKAGRRLKKGEIN